METHYPFSQVMRVRYRDTDAQGHLYFANYMVYADEVAGEFMTDLGHDWSSDAAGSMLVFTANINCDYHGECKFGDAVRVSVAYRRLGRSSAELGFALHMEDGGAALASGTITQVFVDPQTRRSCPIPGAIRAAVLQRQPELASASEPA